MIPETCVPTSTSVTGSTGGRNRIRDRAAPYFSGLQLDSAFRGFAREKEHAPCDEDNGNTAHD